MNINIYEKRLSDYGGWPVLAAWVGGSYAHGVADSQSDIDLRLVIASTRSDILLGRADWTKSAHEPDVTVMTPLAFLNRLLSGAPNAIEVLSTPEECILVDEDLLSRFRPLASSLTVRKTVEGALGNARANLHLLNRRTDFSVRKRNKVLAETLRLIRTVEYVTGGPNARGWMAQVPGLIPTLREVREKGIQIEAIRELLADVENKVTEKPLPVLSEKTRNEATRIVLDLYSDIVGGAYPGLGNQQVMLKLAAFANKHVR